MPGCAAYFAEDLGHTACRVHGVCAYTSEALPGAILWHPDECMTCSPLWESLFSDDVSTNSDALFLMFLIL